MGILERIRKPKGASAPQGDAAMHDESSGAGDRKPAGKRKVSISTVVMTIVLVIGLAIMAYPTFSDWWNSFHQSQAIAAYSVAVDETDPKKLEAMLQAAREYNARLATNGGRFTMTDAQRDEYNSLLNLTGNGMMGYISIPSIGVNLPIYHGVDETHLQVAVGHIEGSSLPVGGETTHSVVSAHRGLPSAKLFTDLDKLSEGDIFIFTVLNQTITYQVDQIRIVEPSDMSDLAITQDADYATLITCTPYGINTHRLLVRGHRVENLEDSAAVAAGAVQIPAYIAVPAVAIPLLFVYLLFALLSRRFRRPELDTQKALDVVRAQAMGEDAPQDGDVSNENEESGGNTEDDEIDENSKTDESIDEEE